MNHDEDDVSTAAAAVNNTNDMNHMSDALLTQTTTDLSSRPAVAGYDFNQGLDYERLLQSYLTTGFQATNLGLAVQRVNEMLQRRSGPFPADRLTEDEFVRRRNGCTIFLGFTSNMVSSGVREAIRFLVQHRLVDCVVTTAGGIEEDLIKCMGATRVGAFGLAGAQLRRQGVNRIGNLLVPNDHYCRFQDWLLPLLDRLADERRVWTPSALVQRLGEAIGSEQSICHWAAANRIPVFCPALSDGALGDVLAFHSFRRPDALVVDLVRDVRRITSVALAAHTSGVLVAGGGVVKHHIANANLMRNGADFCVLLNSAADFDGSDSGATPDEAVSWGKVRPDARPVKVTADATLTFPLLVAQSFAPFHYRQVAAAAAATSPTDAPQSDPPES